MLKFKVKYELFSEDEMPYLYLILSVFLNSSSNVLGKIFTRRNDKNTDSTVFYSFILLSCVFVGWSVLYAVDFSFDAGVILYSVIFAFCFMMSNVGRINALKHGPAALTSLLVSLSLIVTTVWGFFFWNAPVTPIVIIGLSLVIVSMVLCLYDKGEKSEKRISAKWLFFVLIAVFCNAGSSIIQRNQQLRYNGEHGNMLMLFATGLSAIAYFIVYLRSDKRDNVKMLRSSGWLPMLAGACSVSLNLFLMLMVTADLSTSLIYPVIGAGSIAVVTIFSLAVFKEKMRIHQWIGIGVGAVAVVLLSL